MSAADTIFDTVEAMSAPETLPARLVHAPAAMLTAARVFLMLPAAIALAAPALLAVALMVRVGPLTLLLDNPVTLVALCLQPLLWVIVAKFTISGILPRLGAERRAYINAREVRVAERRLGRLYIWRQPLTNYRGIAHTVKATLGGIHHELVLVHPNRRGGGRSDRRQTRR